ncbi:myosin-11-like [Boleophthalmus pectinirostris]|uniref:myosin-11-like n=1 Tax=Boleophthalmus pectinirostris TaxID=150288 RepID=UPI00242D4D61|nr:myosin-11-like [Boleophthalmus pectinirostris]
MCSTLSDNVADHIKSLLNDFKSLHEQRLEYINKSPAKMTGEELQQMKEDVLQCYVKDLTEQNQVLIQAIEDLQKETFSKSGVRVHLSSSKVSAEELKAVSLCEHVGPTAHCAHCEFSLAEITTSLEALEAQLQTKDVVICDLEKKLRENEEQSKMRRAVLLENGEILAYLQTQLSCLQKLQEDNIKEIAEKDICITKLRANMEVLKQEEAQTTAQLKAHEEHVRRVDQDVVTLQSTEDSLKRTLAVKEKHAQALSQDNVLLKERIATLQNQLQNSECMVSETSKSLDEVGHNLENERREKEKIQDLLLTANKEVERLEEELIHLRLSTEKKIQRRETKICALLKDLTDCKRLQMDCQAQLLGKDKAFDKLCEEKDELRAKMADQHKEYIHLKHNTERLEADLALSHEKLHTSHLEVKSRDQLILQLRGEMKTAEQKHHMALEQMEVLEGEVRRLNLKVKGHREETCQLSEEVRSMERLKELEKQEQQQLHAQLCTSHQQVKRHPPSALLYSPLKRVQLQFVESTEAKKASGALETSEEKLKTQRSEIERLHQRLKKAKEQLREACLHAQLQEETIGIFKQKYAAAIEKVHRVQGQVGVLEEELRYSKQQMRESQIASQAVKDELVEMERRYQEKVGQWERAQETLDQLTDELQSVHTLLHQSQKKTETQGETIQSLRGQVDSLQQQKLVIEGDLKVYQQSHLYSDDEYLSQLKQREQLQKLCAEQVEHLAECEKAILQMKSALERQAEEKMDLQKEFVVLQRTHLNSRRQHQQEADQLKQEVTRLELELAQTQQVHVTLLKSEGELREARHEAERKTSEVQRLTQELQKEEQRRSSAINDKHRLKAYIHQLRKEREELRTKHQVTVEELAARAEEARRMEGCLNKEKLAEEKIRSVVLRLETEQAELKRELQEAVHLRLKAQTEKQEAQEQVDSLRLELDAVRANNENLRKESQLVMTNIDQWITQQKAANESVSAQMKAQSTVLSMVTEEKEHLQEANSALKAELQRLKGKAEEKERERLKVQVQLQGQFAEQRCCCRDDRTVEQETCIASNLCKIEEMQTRLQNNLEAVQKLNQQLNILGRENRHLHRTLQEERSLRRQGERISSTSHKTSSTQPLPAFSSLHSTPPETSAPDRFPTQFKDGAFTLDRPAGSQVLGKTRYMKPTQKRQTSLKEERWRESVNVIK